MKLFQILDKDLPMHVVAADWHAALAAWRNLVVEEATLAPEQDPDPEGIVLVCGADELLVVG